MNVLVIEDNKQNLYLARYLLEARGHRVSDARSRARCYPARYRASANNAPAAGCDAYIERLIEPDRFAGEVEAVAAAGSRQLKDPA